MLLAANALLAATALLLAGCSGCGEEVAEVGEEIPERPPVEVVEGMKYYVGGPIMMSDRYGRLRITGFNGRVMAPTQRGLLVGLKLGEDGRFDFRTWLNGSLTQVSTGFADEEGLLWYEERSSYDSQGRVIARQIFAYDDESMIITSTLEEVDPENGEVIESRVSELPYVPPQDDEFEEFLEGEEGG